MSELDTIDASNKFFVGVQGDNIVILRPCQQMSKADAINLAAWLVCLADTNDSFGLVIEKVQST